MTEGNPGPGLLGPIQPLRGAWAADVVMDGAAFVCTRTFATFGEGWMRLDAVWNLPDGVYRETSLFGPADDDEGLGFFSFTNDGKRSVGRLADGSDIHPQAVAFEAQMPGGVARVIHWPPEDGGPGFNFAVESRKEADWNRFFMHRYRPIKEGPDPADS